MRKRAVPAGRQGFILVVAIFVMVVFAVLGMVAVSLISGENILALRDYNSIRAFHLAEAGVNYAITVSLLPDLNWSNNLGYSKNLSPGYFTVGYAYRAERRCILQVSGVVGGITRTILVDVKRSDLPWYLDERYAIRCLNLESQTLYIQNSAAIYGDFYYDGPVIMQNSSKLVNGTMYSDSLTLEHSATCASWEPISTPLEPITFDSSYYDNFLSETAKAADYGDIVKTGTQSINLSDYPNNTFRCTSLALNNSSYVTGPGTIVITTGNLTLSNSASIGDNVMVIVGGTATLQNFSKVGADFNLFTKGNISMTNSQNVPAEAIFYSRGNVNFTNSAQFWGSIMAPSGEVSSVNSTTFNGLLYADTINLQNSTHLNGSAAVNQVGYFRNSSVVTYDPSKFPANVPPGFEGGGGGTLEGLSIISWSEVF